MTVQKRVFDIVFATFLSVLLLPVLVAIAAYVFVREGRPVFFGSKRMRGPEDAFLLWKFRTMRTGTNDGGVTGGDKSGSITASGAWLRSNRLDELPQLWNILKGDISFVGPRPPLPRYVDRFPALYAKVLQCRPGLTGAATLSYHRREQEVLAGCKTAEETDQVYTTVCVPAKARLDLRYAKGQSLCGDALILLKTVRQVIA